MHEKVGETQQTFAHVFAAGEFCACDDAEFNFLRQCGVVPQTVRVRLYCSGA